MAEPIVDNPPKEIEEKGLLDKTWDLYGRTFGTIEIWVDKIPSQIPFVKQYFKGKLKGQEAFNTFFHSRDKAGQRIEADEWQERLKKAAKLEIEALTHTGTAALELVFIAAGNSGKDNPVSKIADTLENVATGKDDQTIVGSIIGVLKSLSQATPEGKAKKNVSAAVKLLDSTVGRIALLTVIKDNEAFKKFQQSIKSAKDKSPPAPEETNNSSDDEESED